MNDMGNLRKGSVNLMAHVSFSFINLSTKIRLPPPSEEGGFLLQPETPATDKAVTGLPFSPEANTASPAANTFSDALTSRSCTTEHPSQTQARTESGNEERFAPQALHVFEVASHCEISTRRRPYHFYKPKHPNTTRA